MNEILIEELLNDDENSALDFKIKQYPFVKADDKTKSELLKDILAFANSGRRTDAYILIGVEELKGNRNIVHGVTEHFDDADIQQFVNCKTNRPITFSYKVFPFENVQIGIFHIPLQDRPIYLKKDFGKIKKHDVYIRHGSATAIATPEEIAQMGERKAIDSSFLLKPDPKIKKLQDDFQNQNTVIVELRDSKIIIPKYEAKVWKVTDLYAAFQGLGVQGVIAGSLADINISFEPSTDKTLYIIKTQIQI